MRLSSIFILCIIVGIGVLESEAAVRTDVAPKKIDIAIVVDQAGEKHKRDAQGVKQVIKDIGAPLLDHTGIDINVRIVILGGPGPGHWPSCKYNARYLADWDNSNSRDYNGGGFAIFVDQNLLKELRCNYADRKISPNAIVSAVWEELKSSPSPRWRRETPKMLIWIATVQGARQPDEFYELGLKLAKVIPGPEIVLTMSEYGENAPFSVYAVNGRFTKMFQSTLVRNGIVSMIERMVDDCKSEVTYDPEFCYYRWKYNPKTRQDDDRECKYDRVYKPVNARKEVVRFCNNGTVSVDCDLSKCEKHCKDEKETEFDGECIGECGGQSLAKGRPWKTARGDPFYIACPWDQRPCTVAPCDQASTATMLATGKTIIASTTKTTTSLVTIKSKMASWLIAVIVLVVLGAVVLIVVIVIVCSKKRRQRRQSAGQALRAYSPGGNRDRGPTRRSSSRYGGRSPRRMQTDRRSPPIDSRVTDYRNPRRR